MLSVSDRRESGVRNYDAHLSNIEWTAVAHAIGVERDRLLDRLSHLPANSIERHEVAVVYRALNDGWEKLKYGFGVKI